MSTMENKKNEPCSVSNATRRSFLEFFGKTLTIIIGSTMVVQLSGCKPVIKAIQGTAKGAGRIAAPATSTYIRSTNERRRQEQQQNRYRP